MSDPDELFSTRTLFWLGSYQAAINEASSNKRIPAALMGEKEEYIYRSFIGLGQYDIVLNELKSKTLTPGLEAVKLFANYLLNPLGYKDQAIKSITEWIQDGSYCNDRTVMIIAASIHVHEDNFKEAFKIIQNGSNLEQYALLVQLYLRIDRIDLAEKQLKIMKSQDEDSILTMLSTAWINTSSGAEKAQEAQYIFEELIDKYGGSAILLNGLAIAKMQLGFYEDAESNLQEALTKTPSDPDSLANLISVAYHLQRSSDVINRYLSQLKSKAPHHKFVVSVDAYEASFDRAAATLA